MIQLTDNVAVTADQYQYIVGTPRTRPDKGITINKPRYYTTLAGAVKGALSQALRDKVADGTITTLRGWLDEYQKITNEFTKRLEPLEA